MIDEPAEATRSKGDGTIDRALGNVRSGRTSATRMRLARVGLAAVAILVCGMTFSGCSAPGEPRNNGTNGDNNGTANNGTANDGTGNNGTANNRTNNNGTTNNNGEPCDGECSGAAPVCDERTDTCVECTDADDGQCPGLCVEQACVECTVNGDCDDVAASACDDTTNTCGACESSDDCAHLGDTTLCDGGTCVECTVDDESACGGNSCNPATNTCTDTPTESVSECEPCVADSECMADHRCVPMFFQGVERDTGYCLKMFSTGCEAPYGVPIMRESVSGVAEENYCGISETRTTCEAVLDLKGNEQCNDDDDCGAADLDDGLCTLVNGMANRCSFRCVGDAECLDTQSCGSLPGDDDYCGYVQ